MGQSRNWNHTTVPSRPTDAKCNTVLIDVYTLFGTDPTNYRVILRFTKGPPVVKCGSDKAKPGAFRPRLTCETTHDLDTTKNCY